MFKNQATIAALIAAVFAPLAFSQEDEQVHRQDVTVQALGSFAKTTTDNGVSQTATNSGGVLATYRFFFDRHNGVEVNYAYSLNSQLYGLPAGSTGVRSTSHEATAAYLLRFPMRRWSPFILAGVGGLVFDPGQGGGATTQAVAAFVYGGGVDLKLVPHIFLRAQYRGLVYKSPTFDMPVLASTDRVTHRAEPSIGFGFSF